MGVSYSEAKDKLNVAVSTLFADKSIKAVGITRHDDAFGYRAVRSGAIEPQAGMLNLAGPNLDEVDGVPVSIVSAPGDIEHQLIVPDQTPTTHATATTVPEVRSSRPLVAGLQIENFNDDVRRRASGALNAGFIIIGTLGCFVKLANGKVALLSNNHVVAAEDDGLIGADQIYQPGSIAVDPAMNVGTLSRFKALTPSPAGIVPPNPGIVFNDIDAGIAELGAGVRFRQGYLASRHLVRPHATAPARIGDRVFKVGRTTGLTHGTVTSVRTVVGPVTYRPGECWFQDSIEIEGIHGTLFSDHGDSGSAIVRDTGEIVGLLYAGNGQQTYACPIAPVLAHFGCTLA